MRFLSIGLWVLLCCCTGNKAKEAVHVSYFEDSVLVQGAGWQRVLQRTSLFSEVAYQVDTIAGYLYINDFSSAIYAIELESGEIKSQFDLDGMYLGKNKRFKITTTDGKVIFSTSRMLLILTKDLQKRAELVKMAFDDYPDLDIAEYVIWDYFIRKDSIFIELAYKLPLYQKEDSILIAKSLHEF